MMYINRLEDEARKTVENLLDWREELLDESSGYKTAWIETIESRIERLEWALKNPEFLEEILEEEWKRW